MPSSEGAVCTGSGLLVAGARAQRLGRNRRGWRLDLAARRVCSHPLLFSRLSFSFALLAEGYLAASICAVCARHMD